jgi:hypothetical protein
MNMNMRISSTRSLSSALAVSLVLLALGCGDDGGLARRYAVSGKVIYKGAPVNKGAISFVPTTAEGRGAAGQIEDGHYSLTTLDPGDGAIPGKYKVTLDDRQLDEAKLKAQADELGRRKGMKLSMIPQEYQAAALKKAKGVLPGKYQVASTSDVEVEVKPQSNRIDIELKD